MRERSKLARMLLRLVRPVWRVRRLALLSELLFWDRWLARRFSDPSGAARLRDDALVPESLWRFIERAAADPVKILEVGAGPFASIGSGHPTRRVEVTATDVLADKYNRILRRRGITPKVPTVYADAERLSQQFGPATFDLVYAANCIDHTDDALRAIQEMVSVVRPGGYIVMDHFEDEGAHQDYAGLHKWNLKAADGKLLLWNLEQRHDVSRILAGSCDVEVSSAGSDLHVEIRKREIVPAAR
jgi:SAM-dependent methyltransferase